MRKRPPRLRQLALAAPLASIALLSGSCAIGPREFVHVSEARVAAVAPPPLRAVYEGAIRGTALGLLHRPVSSTSAGLAALKNRSRALVPVELLPISADAAAPEGPVPGTPAFERALDSAGIGSVHSGRVVSFLRGPEFFQRLNEEIAAAERSIDWMIYIFDNDDFAVAVADQLRAKRPPVRPRLMIDRLGSVMAGETPPRTPFPPTFERPVSVGRYLERDSAVRVREQPNPWLVSDHRKLLLFDRKTAFLGGMNIGREYRSEWNDLMVELEGPVVEALAAEFDRSWQEAGWFGDFRPSLSRFPQRQDRASGGIPIRVLETAPWNYEIERAQLAAIRASRRRIVVMNPYFTSDPIKRELQAAARRGVEVRVILPRENDSGIMGLSNRESAAQLAAHGVIVHHYPGLMHLKAAIYDGWVCLGSANMDTLSLRINRELNVAFSDPATVERFRRQVVEPDLRKSPRVPLRELQEQRVPWIEPIGDQL